MMFGISQITRYARQWHSERKRRAMENTMLDLPAELQKDIGWPGPAHRPASNRTRRDVQARPIV